MSRAGHRAAPGRRAMLGALAGVAAARLAAAFARAIAAATFAMLAVGTARAEPPLADDALWQQIARGGHVLLLRHASTEAGLGDPPHFRIGDCGTQRNLSAAGRDEARRIGQAIAARAVQVDEVRSSPWCRCLETARLAFGRAEPWPALSSLFNDPARQARRTDEVLAVLKGWRGAGNLVLVTHQFNIRALTGVSPRPGETVVARLVEGRLEAVGRLPAP